MKAQTFLEWFAGYIENHALTNDGDLTNTALTFHKLKDFYSQPFKPELITELFEGWKYETDLYEGLYYNPKTSKIIRRDGDVGLNTYAPDTINDFISDCNRAGIELNWKPEIVKEYFA